MSDRLRGQADVVAKIFDMRHLFLQCCEDADVPFFSGEQGRRVFSLKKVFSFQFSVFSFQFSVFSFQGSGYRRSFS